jgi:hypothetical protein
MEITIDAPAFLALRAILPRLRPGALRRWLCMWSQPTLMAAQHHCPLEFTADDFL